MMALLRTHTPQSSDRDFVSESSFFQPIGIKQGRVSDTLWQRLGTFVPVLCLSKTDFKKDILNITRFLKTTVIIHGRGNNISCKCIVCTKRFEILTIFSMYRFCSEECYEQYRKLPTKKQQELSNC